jgi:micrococcal nuclease
VSAWKHIVWLVVAAACFAGGFYYGTHKEVKKTTSSEFKAQCLTVLDGDTVRVAWFMGTNSVRLIGIDAPEVHDNKKLNDQARQLGLKPKVLLQIGNNAKNILARMIEGKEITLIFPETANKRDSFGRLLAYVYVDGEDVGLNLLRRGLVYTRNEPHPKRAIYNEEAEEAKKAKRGVWAW